MLGIYLKQYMQTNGIRQRLISEKTGIRPEALGAMLEGQRKIEVAEYYDICAAMGVSPTQIAMEAGIYSVSES